MSAVHLHLMLNHFSIVWFLIFLSIIITGFYGGQIRHEEIRKPLKKEVENER
jgi:uncharacterized membrane protein